MLVPDAHIRIWLYGEPADMRKSYNGLSSLVRSKLADDPTSGQLFVFINRRRTQMKVLYFDGSGYCVWAKRLEQGTFHPGAQTRRKRRLDWTHLKLIIDGIDTDSLRRYKRFPDARRGALMLTSAP
jgi:transposase